MNGAKAKAKGRTPAQRVTLFRSLLKHLKVEFKYAEKVLKEAQDALDDLEDEKELLETRLAFALDDKKAGLKFKSTDGVGRSPRTHGAKGKKG